MGKTRRVNLFLAMVMVLIAAFSCFFAVRSLKSEDKVTASAATIEYKDLLGIENRDWGAHEGEYYFGGVTLNPFGYFNTADSASGAWYVGNNTVIAGNNGCDIMQYIYVNGQQARKLITDNANGNRDSNSCKCWLSNPAAYPVYVETTNGSGIIIKVAKAFSGDNFTLTFKAGFSLIRNDGETIYLSEDVDYAIKNGVPSRLQKYTVSFTDELSNTIETRRIVAGETIGELPAVPAKAGYAGFWTMDGKKITAETVISSNKTIVPVYAMEYMDLLGLEDRTPWGAHSGEYYFGAYTIGASTANNAHYLHTDSSVNGAWYVGNDSIIAGNNGCDIMQYIYVNGVQARQAITANANGDRVGNTCDCWLSNPAAYPIYVETTNGSGLMIRIAKAWSGDTLTITFKAGFSIIRNDGQVICLSDDVTYNYNGSSLTKVEKYTLSFKNEGGAVIETKRYENGAKLGDIPSVPLKEGFEGEWQIDGVAITSETVYNYGADKTATPVYVKDITSLLGIEDRTSWGAHSGEYYFGGVYIEPLSYLNTHSSINGCWYVGNNALISANSGCDIMEYIYVNGVQARQAITANANGDRVGNTCGCWLSNPAAYPIYVETTVDSGIMIRIAKAWSGNTLTITFKAGLRLLDVNGYPMVIHEDITYRYNNGLTRLNNYTLAFDGLLESKRVTQTMAIGTLPEVPELEGFIGEWQIDGVAITPETVYNYGADKTAVAVYKPIVTGTDISDTLLIEDWGNAESNDYSYIIVTNKGVTLEARADLKVYWNDHASSANANEGCDLMEYIYINGVSARAIVTQNATDRKYPTKSTSNDTFNYGGVFAPVLVNTSSFNGGSIIIRVLTEYAAKGTFTVTLKKDLKLVNTTGELLILGKDVDLKYNLNYVGISSEKVLPGAKLVAPETPVMEETESHTYPFLGWYVADLATGESTGVKWNFDNDVVTGALSLTPVFDEVEKELYTVKFEANNGTTIPSIHVYEGSFVKSWQIPNDPVKTATGYTYDFAGWYLGEDLYDFTSPVTENITLTAKFIATRGLNLSDLYNSAFTQTADFKDGQVQATAAGEKQVGYNGNEAFTLQFDIKFDTTPSGLSTFGVKMVKTGASLIPSSSDFYLGWHVYFYRPNNTSYITVVSSNGVENGEGRNTLKAWDWDAGVPTLTAGNSYTVKLSYKLLDAATGKVEIYTKIAGFESKGTYVLGADYVANAKDYNQLYFYVEGADNAVLKFSDSGYMDKPSYEATFSDGKTVETVSGRHFVLPEREEADKTFVGWSTSENFVAGVSNLYPAGYDMPASNGLKLYAVWIDFALQDGAAVKTGGGGGIRFLADIDSATYTAWEKSGLIVGAGTLIVPTSYLESLPFVHGSFPAGYYNDVALEQWFKQEGNTWTYSAALINIPDTLYARSLSAKGYLKISYSNGEVGYVYTYYDETNNSRSMYEIATKAYDDYKSVVATYVNGVADIQLDKDFTASLSETAAKIGEYSVSSVRSGATVTVTLTKNPNAQTNVGISLASALINGVRVVAGYTATIEIDGLYWDVKKDAIIGDSQLTFTLTPSLIGAGKNSDEFVYYNSSDEELNFFLNDFTKRHSAYVENGVNQKVNSTTAGVNSQEFFSQEWNSLAYYWYDTVGSNDGYTEDRATGLREFLTSVPVDDYGYVWQSNDNVRANNSTPTSGEHRMGWPFPNNSTMSTPSWEFGSSGDKTKWESSGISASNSNGLYQGTANGATGSITLTSKYSYSAQFKTYYSPLLEFDIRIEDASNVEDIYVWYQTSSSRTWTEDKRVSVNEKAFISYPYSGKYEHIIFLPMYAESAWGASTSTKIAQIRIEIKIKSGASLSGNVALNCVRPTMDTRHSNNNSILISSLRQDYDYTGDLDFLAANITRARKAMNFLMQMYDSARGLNNQSYLVGHDGNKEDLDWLGKATPDSIAGSLSNGYWDISFMPAYDFQSNMYFYKALADMAHMEEVLEKNGIVVDKSLATVKTADRQYNHGTSAYTYTSDSLNTLAETVKSAMQANAVSNSAGGFWNPTTGRFIAGYDADGNKYDYGYVAWNLEAIYYGIATDAQAASIMNWLESEDDLYKYVFAPISNTVQDSSLLNGEYEAKGDSWLNCQYGGAIMYTSFYDLMARIDVLGADNAYGRLTSIKDWYMQIYNSYVESGSTPDDFYWDYYYGVKYNGQHALQNGPKGTEERNGETAGVLGIDGEFLESYLLVSAVPYGFFGIDSLDGNTLQIAPALPTDLDYFTMENLAFNNVKYDLTIFEDCLQITSVRGAVDGQKIQAVFSVEGKTGYKVYVNGVQTNNYTVKDGKVFVTLDFGAAIVEVR